MRPAAYAWATPRYASQHGSVRAHRVRRAVGDLPPVVEHDHAVGDVHDHAHVVLDEGDRGAELVAHVEDEAAHVLLLLDVHARHGLVEQEEGRLRRERAGQLDPLLQAIRQAARRRLPDGLDLQEVDDPLDHGAVLELLLLRRPPVEGVEQDIAPHLEQPARHDVVEHAHPLEEGHVLKRPRDAERGHVVGAKVRAVPALVQDAARGGVVEPADHVEQRGLAGAVRADDRDGLAPPDVEADARQRLHGSKVDADVLDGEEGVGGSPVVRHAFGTAANVSASRMRTSARTVAVRPSSYVTWASTLTTSLSE